MVQENFDTKLIEKARAAGRSGGTVTFLPEPEPREVVCPILSVDDHLVEPRDAFVGRLPQKYVERGPHVDERDDGAELWVVDGQADPNIGYNAVIGRPRDEWRMEPARFDEMRPGAWDIDARVRDMDIAGAYASLNFPSHLCGFSGQRFALRDDRGFALALVRAWNDWHIEDWAARHPGRIVACQIPMLADPDLAAAEIRRNAARGFRAVAFADNPEALGLPSLYTDHWTPFFAACDETETVVCLHVGSSSSVLQASADAPQEARTVLFPFNAGITAVDWLFSGTFKRHPGLKVALSEGGIGWVPQILDRLEHYWDVHYGTALMSNWPSPDDPPADVMRRHFWFCLLEDSSVFELRERIGTENILLEVDYPHADSTWPESQSVVSSLQGRCTEAELQAVCYGNAAALYRHPLPSEVVWRGGLGGIAPTPAVTT